MKTVKKFLKQDYRRRSLKECRNPIGFDELADYARGGLSESRRDEIEAHISDCYRCLDVLVSISDGLRKPKKKRGAVLKAEYLYLISAIVCFVLSFLLSDYFLQFLAATIVLGAKWIIDSKTTRTLITIRKAIEEEPSSENIKNRLKSEKIM